MMNYGHMGQYPYYQNGAFNPYQPSPFVSAMQQNYGTQQPQQTQQNQQNISTQPPILQPNTNAVNGNKILAVANKEEATGAPVDLVSGTPSFFYNKSNGEIYLKQFDVASGTAIFKVYGEIVQPKEDVKEPVQAVNYDKELHYIADGIDNLHRMQADLKQTIEKLRYYDRDEEVIDIEPEQIKTRGKKHA